GSVDEAVVEAALAPLWEPPALDTVVLGCTHFPLLRAHFPAPRPVTWVDSGAAIARRVDQVLGAPRWAATPPAAAWATDAHRAGLAAACQAFGFPPPRPLAV
ncbi:MAG TPA: glutamate racemase, partial [Alcanivorax sp.]|nr:glutamate racemase [Alcanivorax sp.]